MTKKNKKKISKKKTKSKANKKHRSLKGRRMTWPSQYTPCFYDGHGTCDGPEKYPVHVHRMTKEVIRIERDIHKRGFKGLYRPHQNDPNVRIEWECRRHYLQSEFGLAKATCPECGEEFAFSTNHIYMDDDEDEVHCPRCMSVVFSWRKEPLWKLKDKWYDEWKEKQKKKGKSKHESKR